VCAHAIGIRIAEPRAYLKLGNRTADDEIAWQVRPHARLALGENRSNAVDRPEGAHVVRIAGSIYDCQVGFGIWDELGGNS
jgi:hypothetical protein